MFWAAVKSYGYKMDRLIRFAMIGSDCFDRKTRSYRGEIDSHSNVLYKVQSVHRRPGLDPCTCGFLVILVSRSDEAK